MGSCWYRTMAGGGVRGRVTDGSDSPVAAGRLDRARVMALKTVPGWLRLHLQIWVAPATANGQARERASDERGRKAERGGVGTPHSLWRVWNRPWDQRERAGLSFLALAGLVTHRLGDSAAWQPVGSPAQWQTPGKWGCVGTRDRAT